MTNTKHKSQNTFKIFAAALCMLGGIAFLNTHTAHANDAAPVENAEQQKEPLTFFSAIPDLPIMPGMVEMPEQSTVFDKPEGRIVQSTTYLDGIKADKVMVYYLKTLPQMGWTYVNPTKYQRENEVLTIEFEQPEDVIYVKFNINPAE